MLAQLSDLHLRPDDPASVDKVRRAVAAVTAMDPLPDALLVSGDVADVPGPRSTRAPASCWSAAGLPLLVVPGNHDDRDLLVAAFGPLPVVATAGSLRVVGVDTSRPGRADGRLEAEDLEPPGRRAGP